MNFTITLPSEFINSVLFALKIIFYVFCTSFFISGIFKLTRKFITFGLENIFEKHISKDIFYIIVFIIISIITNYYIFLK